MHWKTIDTAPKDRRILLFRPKSTVSFNRIVMGRWNEDGYVKKPCPYWTHDREHLTGKRDAQKYPPTHWCEIDEPTS